MMQRRKILEGLRVVELGQLIAVPYATKLLSDMGAEVIRIESANRPDIYRLSDFMMIGLMVSIGIVLSTLMNRTGIK